MEDKSNKKYWYAHIHGNPFDASSYFRLSIQPEFNIGNHIAAVYAKGNEHRPDDFSNKLKTLIADALASGVSQPHPSEPTIVIMKP